MHTLLKFKDAEPWAEIFLTLPSDQITIWRQLCQDYNFDVKHTVVNGGATRFGSVQNALKLLPATKGLVAVHDGVRPLVSVKVIQESFKAAAQHGSAITAVPVKDSVRQITESGSQNINRDLLRLVQTPQTFKLELLCEAFEKATHNQFTDDASVAEAAGHKIHLITGQYSNIKITTPEDMLLAEALLRNEG